MPRCQICGGEIRFSHREYAGRGESKRVFRCITCGATERHREASAESDQPRRSTRKQPIDEGPPSNPVLDAELAARLLRNSGEG